MYCRLVIYIYIYSYSVIIVADKKINKNIYFFAFEYANYSALALYGIFLKKKDIIINTKHIFIQRSIK